MILRAHRLRTMHDGILIGVGTLLNDNPQLNGEWTIPFVFSRPHLAN